MDAMIVFRDALKSAHKYFRATVADVTSEDARYVPPGIAHPIGSRYAHCVTGDDFLVHVFLQGGAPLYETTFKNKTGISAPRLDAPLEWARTVQVDLPALANYMDATFAASEAYFDSMNEKDLERTVDLTAAGVGVLPMPVFLADFVIGHLHDVMGEISAVKGLLGKKGYPF
ncbi:MAG: DinB family protein [Chloroflexi bacterium]|nr:DinB family protein [Chloroflexota bacterium]MBI3741652.1 DinB family protein [Chloroflexota bacterium]